MSQHLSGLTAWLIQRLSAVYMTVYVLLALLALAAVPVFDFTNWHALMAHPVSAIATAMFFLALFLHSWVGIRDVILDYAGHWPAIRLSLLALFGGWMIAMAIWVMKVLVMVMIR